MLPERRIIRISEFLIQLDVAKSISSLSALQSREAKDYRKGLVAPYSFLCFSPDSVCRLVVLFAVQEETYDVVMLSSELFDSDATIEYAISTIFSDNRDKNLFEDYTTQMKVSAAEKITGALCAAGQEGRFIDLFNRNFARIAESDDLFVMSDYYLEPFVDDIKNLVRSKAMKLLNYLQDL